MAKGTTHFDKLRRLYDALAESVLDLSDEEVLAECREAGEDPDEIAERVGGVIHAAIAEYERRRAERRADGER